ncbi:hypothetical protein QE152_g29274 [Popillia japonica]|uniref:Uncharacterized protein n=1 Tax=Popillia japonica TaxID=7064 RepID=A0AAW1JIK7_POPJA
MLEENVSHPFAGAPYRLDDLNLFGPSLLGFVMLEENVSHPFAGAPYRLDDLNLFGHPMEQLDKTIRTP